MNYLLPAIILTPIVGAIAIMLAWRNDPKRGPRAACVVAALTLLLSISLGEKVWKAPLASDEAGPVRPRISFAPEWMSIDLPVVTSGYAVRWHLSLGVDGPGLALVCLTSLITLSTLLVSSRLIDHRATDYAAMILFTSAGMLGVFLSMDLLLFYIFFELTLIPLLVLITVWGDKSTAWPAARKFLIYTLAGSIPMVVGFAGIAFAVSSSAGIEATISIPEIAKAVAAQHAELHAATSSASGTLASRSRDAAMDFRSHMPRIWHQDGVVAFSCLAPHHLCLIPSDDDRSFGCGRVKTWNLWFSSVGLPLLPLAAEEFAVPLLGSLGAVAVVFGALLALGQRDLRLLLAYSSLSHVGFITLGLFSLTTEGASGATLQLVNHGLTTGSVPPCCSVDDRRRTSEYQRRSARARVPVSEDGGFLRFLHARGDGCSWLE